MNVGKGEPAEMVLAWQKLLPVLWSDTMWLYRAAMLVC